jgi:hypothetical protein
MSNTRQIQPVQIWTATGQKEVSILALTNFFDYHFDDGSGKVNYKLIGMISNTTTDDNGNIINLPASAIEYINSTLDIPSNIIQQWGASDDIIWNYVSQQLNLTLI